MTNEKHTLNDFNGTEQYHYNPFFKNINYTDGVKFIGDNKGSWLVTDILSVLSHEQSVLKVYEEENFISILINFEGDTATATYGDGNGNNFFKQKYEYTDFLKHFQTEKNELMLFYTNDVLMLGSEY